MTEVLSSFAVPDIHLSSSIGNLRDSTQLYNQLQDISAQPTEVSEQHLEGLAQILVCHDVHNRFGIHLIHSHFKLDECSIMLRTPIPERSGYWTRQVDISKVDLHDIHGHVFALGSNGHFMAYEYGTGPASDMSTFGPKFLCDVVQYLTSNKLDDILGLEILDSAKERDVEFDLGKNLGTITFGESHCIPVELYRVTTWLVEEKEGNIRCRGQKKCEVTRSGHHYTYTTGTAGGKISDVAELEKVLNDAGIILDCQDLSMQ